MSLILTPVYRGIVLLMLCMSVWNMFRQKDWREQLAAMWVICPLLLRFLMIK